MAKRGFSLIISLLLISLSCFVCSAEEWFSASMLNEAGHIKTYSSSNGAYIYGYSSKTLYCSQLAPQRLNRYATIGHTIRGAVHSGNITYALCYTDKASYTYEITAMNMADGELSTYKIRNVKDVFRSSFGVSDGYAYFIRSDSTYTYVAVYYLSGGYAGKINFDRNAVELFNNNSKTYVMLDNGSVCQLNGTNCTYANSFGFETEIYNAGAGWICAENGKLISLNSDAVKYTSALSEGGCVCSENSVYSIIGSQLERKSDDETSYANAEKTQYILNSGDEIIAVDNSFNYRYISENEFGSTEDDNNSPKQSREDIPPKYSILDNTYLCKVKAGTKVSQLKNEISSDLRISYNSETLVNSKLVRTGCILELDGDEYIIIVSGDLTGEGNIKSNDTLLLMNSFIDSELLSKAQQLASDFNNDGKTNCKDLVAMLREIE